MKPYVRGRALGIPLNGELEVTVAQLEARGFTDQRAKDVAEAARRYAEQESETLVRQLTPKASWPGYVCVRRHYILKTEEAWLLLRYDEGEHWSLDAALVS